MKSNDNKQFWNRVSHRYDFIIKKDAKAYEMMYSYMADDLKSDMHALELATGTGLISLRIAEHVKSVIATDFSPEMVAEAKKKTAPDNLHFSVEDATALTFQGDSFDVVIISNALHIMSEPERVLAEVHRVLKPDGILIAPSFTHRGSLKQRLLSRAMSLTGFKVFHKWTPESYVQFLSANGFAIRRHEIICATFPLVYAVAAKN